MSDPIGPGDMVECVNVMPHATSDPDALRLLTIGGIYQVREIIIDHPRWPTGELRLVGVFPYCDRPYRRTRFRLIGRRSHFEAILKQLKTPAPELETEDA